MMDNLTTPFALAVDELTEVSANLFQLADKIGRCTHINRVFDGVTQFELGIMEDGNFKSIWLGDGWIDEAPYAEFIISELF